MNNNWINDCFANDKLVEYGDIINRYVKSYQLSNTKPLYEHNCDKCIFLKSTNYDNIDYDLYFCKKWLPTILARKSDQLSDYLSGIGSAHIEPILFLTLDLSVRSGFLPFESIYSVNLRKAIKGYDIRFLLAITNFVSKMINELYKEFNWHSINNSTLLSINAKINEFWYELVKLNFVIGNNIFKAIINPEIHNNIVINVIDSRFDFKPGVGELLK
ncbi:MAG: hypothetical protein BV456_00635 [Thermoplasmata archaeon M8B2D]|nr:MAG: hypothetical protein BV456_00635 [Thermoplasmata archaeon M8B2D]